MTGAYLNNECSCFFSALVLPDRFSYKKSDFPQIINTVCMQIKPLKQKIILRVMTVTIMTMIRYIYITFGVVVLPVTHGTALVSSRAAKSLKLTLVVENRIAQFSSSLNSFFIFSSDYFMKFLI